MTLNCVLCDESDERGWKSYELDTHGTSLAELIGNATVTARDKDGEDLFTLSIYQCDDSLLLAAFNAIEMHITVGNYTGRLPEPADFECA